jgi:hypothetical protein
LGRLRAFARRVARELGGVAPTTRSVEYTEQIPVTTSRFFGLSSKTVIRTEIRTRTENIPGSKWELGHRVTNHRYNHGRGEYSEAHSVDQYYLGWDGSLFCESENWEDGISDRGYWCGGHDYGHSPMEEWSVLLFDHPFLDPSRRVNVHAKGVGLSKRLSELRDAGR